MRKHEKRQEKMKIELERLTLKNTFQLQQIIKKEIAEPAYLEWPFTKQVAESFIANYNTYGIWINGGVLVGAVEVKDDGEIAYLISTQWQNKGIATFAVKACIEHFNDRQLWCYINPENQASLRVARKANLRVQYYK